MGLNLSFNTEPNPQSSIGDFDHRWEILKWLEDTGALHYVETYINKDEDEYRFYEFDYWDINLLRECCERILKNPETAKDEMENPKGGYDQEYFDTIEELYEMLKEKYETLYVYVDC